MAKSKTLFVCSQCEYSTAKWLGKCPECGAWNSLVEQAPPTKAQQQRAKAVPSAAVKLNEVPLDRGGDVRVRTGIGELDSVLGGGLVAGSLVLLGGDPGIGKSTLLLMALDGFSRRGIEVLYASGEESTQQVRLRAQRLGIDGEHVWLAAETDFARIAASIEQQKPRIAVIDSVQTVTVPELTSVPGSVGQVREVAHRCMQLAKGQGIAVLLVGHVTKTGELAGPKVLEHLVDTVLQFEGDPDAGIRVLRAVKNRFGAAGELGLFEMTDAGLREVPDASVRLLAERAPEASGTAVLCAVEGSRPVLAEIQALVGRPSPSIPARTCVGVDRSRVLMICAVLQKAGLPLHDRDVFVNAAGGLRLQEPAADLAILAAIASSLLDRPLPTDVALFGEVGLVGELRATSRAGQRLREADRHGFRRVIAPKRAAADAPESVTLIGLRTVSELLSWLREVG